MTIISLLIFIISLHFIVTDNNFFSFRKPLIWLLFCALALLNIVLQIFWVDYNDYGNSELPSVWLVIVNLALLLVLVATFMSLLYLIRGGITLPAPKQDKSLFNYPVVIACLLLSFSWSDGFVIPESPSLPNYLFDLVLSLAIVFLLFLLIDGDNDSFSFNKTHFKLIYIISVIAFFVFVMYYSLKYYFPSPGISSIENYVAGLALLLGGVFITSLIWIEKTLYNPLNTFIIIAFLFSGPALAWGYDPEFSEIYYSGYLLHASFILFLYFVSYESVSLGVFSVFSKPRWYSIRAIAVLCFVSSILWNLDYASLDFSSMKLLAIVWIALSLILELLLGSAGRLKSSVKSYGDRLDKYSAVFILGHVMLLPLLIGSEVGKIIIFGISSIIVALTWLTVKPHPVNWVVVNWAVGLTFILGWFIAFRVVDAGTYAYGIYCATVIVALCFPQPHFARQSKTLDTIHTWCKYTDARRL